MPSKAHTVLVIEDEDTLRDMYKMKFESSGLTFVGAATGEEGLKLAEEKRPDIILVDLMLENKVAGGRVDGFFVIKKLHEIAALKGVPIYALTNLNQESDIKKAKEAGADGFLVKSDMTPKELVENTQKILAGEKVGLLK